MSKKLAHHKRQVDFGGPDCEGLSLLDTIQKLLDRDWEEVKMRNFMTATRQCVRSGCKKFKSQVAAMLKQYKVGEEDVSVLYTPLELTDYTATTDKTLDEYARSVFEDKKIKEMLKQKQLVPVQVGVRELFARDPTTKEVKERVDTIYCLLMSAETIDKIAATAVSVKAPAKSNAPSTD
jgi:hypothetical protein